MIKTSISIFLFALITTYLQAAWERVPLAPYESVNKLVNTKDGHVILFKNVSIILPDTNIRAASLEVMEYNPETKEFESVWFDSAKVEVDDENRKYIRDAIDLSSFDSFDKDNFFARGEGKILIRENVNEWKYIDRPENGNNLIIMDKEDIFGIEKGVFGLDSIYNGVRSNNFGMSWSRFELDSSNFGRHILHLQSIGADRLVAFSISKNIDNTFAFFVSNSSDAGKTWTREEINRTSVNQFYIIDENKGYCLSKYAEDKFFGLYESSYTFSDWTLKQYMIPEVYAGSFRFLFYTKQIGIIYDSDYAFISFNGGESWQTIYDGEDPFFPEKFREIVFLSPNKLAAVSRDKYSLWYYDLGAVGVEDKADSRPLLSPNPASPGETIAVSVPESAGVCRVRLLDGFGRTISEIEEVAANSKLEFRLPEGLVSGIYWMRIECGEQIFVEKFVVLE